MSAYVTNPSKMVTELLSRYLEFDPEQLQLGIWSGNLSLSNVSLKEESIYPLLNSGRTFSSSSTSHTSTYTKPPLRFKLISGTVGTFRMKIPWKRLVWGQGDVKVEIRDVFLVLAFESHQDAVERWRAAHPERSNSDDPALHAFCTFQEDMQQQTVNNPYGHHDLADMSRERKQRMIIDAERRHLQGRNLSSWLRTMRKKEKLERARKAALETSKLSIKQQEGRLEGWLRSAMNDFFWRFSAGLQATIENVKIVLIHEGIEFGLVIPSISINPGGLAPPVIRKSFVKHEKDDSIDLSERTVPDDIVYEGEFDDGEHVDKQVKIIGLATYVRRAKTPHQPSDAIYHPVDVSVREHLLRPMDVSFSFNFFYPYPPERRKKARKRSNEKRDVDEATVTNDSSTMSSRRRRGKREKIQSPTNEEVVATTIGEEDTPAPQSTASIERNNTPNVSFKALPPLFHQRRKSSIGRFGITPERRLTSVLSRSISVPRAGIEHRRTNTSLSLPLAQPDDVKTYYAAATSGQGGHITPRLDGHLAFGLVQLMCSTHQYDYLKRLLVAAAKMRNGRPSKTIASLIFSARGRQYLANDEDTSMSTSRQDSEPSSSSSSSIDEDDSAVDRAEFAAEKSKIVKSWWRYAMGVVIWELRQRRKVREYFNKRFLSFNWASQRYKRDTYVKCFIALRLNRKLMTLQWPEEREFEEELLKLEDGLPLEQIMLYRSIARAIHVRGGTSMPESIQSLHNDITSPLHTKTAQKSKLKHIHKIHRAEDAETPPDEPYSALSRIADQCELARVRRDLVGLEKMPSFPSYARWSDLSGRDAFSIDFDDGRSLASSKTHTLALMERLSNMDKDQGSMLFSFSVKVEKVELLVTEDEMFSVESVGQPASRFSGESTGSVGSFSDLSGLTEDERLFGEAKSDDAQQENSSADPIVSSAEYLLFKMPERILLKSVLGPFSCSARGRAGSSQNFNFRVGRVKVESEGDVELLEIGGEPDEFQVDLPVHQHEYHGASRFMSDDSDRSSGRDALLLSFVIKKDESALLQCDAARLKCCLSLGLLARVQEFYEATVSSFPSSALQRNPREDVRIYLLRQETPSPLSDLNCSVRFHGFNVKMTSDKKCEESSNLAESSLQCSAIDLQVGMIELYSGKAVDSLRSSTPSLQPLNSLLEIRNSSRTRCLGMLDLSALTQSMVLSYWVLAMSGLDLAVFSAPNGIENNRINLLERPVEVEALLSINSQSSSDFNRAKYEISVEVSPVDILLSENRMRLASDLLPRTGRGRRKDLELPPRIEALSCSASFAIDASVRRIRATVLTDDTRPPMPTTLNRQLEMEECLSDFLSVVSSFDLSFPNEDALNCAMLICVDRLHGIGLSVDDSWEASNTALLSFLEDIANARHMQAQIDSFEATSQREESTERLIHITLEKCVERTVGLFVDRLEQARDLPLFLEEVVVEFPKGLKVSTIQLYYDFHVSLVVPITLVATGSGIHLLRVTPPEKRDLAVAEDRDSPSSDEQQGTMEIGLALLLFGIDKQTPFGRGGAPLLLLGTDASDRAGEERHREYLVDITMGDVDFLFSGKIASEVIGLFAKVFSPFAASRDAASGREQHGADVCVVLIGHFCSVILATDDYTPFTRVSLVKFVGKQWKVFPLVDEDEGEAIKFLSESMTVLNLTREGQLHPVVLAMLVNPRLFTIEFRYVWSHTSSKCYITLTHARVIFLKQYMNELLRFFNIIKHGFSRIFEQSKQLSPQNSSQPTAVPLKVVVTLSQMSIILPRSSSSSDMIAIEVEEARSVALNVSGTFRLPSASEPLRLIDDDDSSSSFYACITGDERASSSGVAISRTIIELSCFRIFMSTSEGDKPGDWIESPAFHRLYCIDGRAASMKNVYKPQGDFENEALLEDVAETNMEKARRYWREVTTRELSLGIILDYAPHMRLLITDPIPDCGGIELDMTLSQFGLLLSIWYCNMQELPIMFPHSAQEIRHLSSALTEETPDHGSSEERAFFRATVKLTSEVAVVLKNISLGLASDHIANDQKDVARSRLRLALDDCVIHVSGDSRGVTKVGSGCGKAVFADDSKRQETVLSVEKESILTNVFSWADMNFGLDRNFSQIGELLDLPFQLSIFMTKDRSLYHLGMNNPRGTMSDFSSVLRLLDYVSAYFTNPRYGNPHFEIQERAEKLKSELKGGATSESHHDNGAGGLIDFRLWVVRPSFCVPSDADITTSPSIRIEAPGGIWYKYMSIGDLSSQECVSDSGAIIFDDASHYFTETDIKKSGRAIVEGLSFGLRFDSNSCSNHSDMSLKIPFDDKKSCAVTSCRIQSMPLQVEPPMICVPYERPKRCLGATVCELTCLVDALPVAAPTLLGLFGNTGDTAASADESGESSQDSRTFSFIAEIADVRVFALDPVLGPHLPIAVVSVSSLYISASQFATAKGPGKYSPMAPEDVQVMVKSCFWADYFKLGLTRSWEPLLEAYKFILRYEKSRSRGSGFWVSSDSPFRMNISSALLVILDEIVDVFQRLVGETVAAELSNNHDMETFPPPVVGDSAILNEAYNGNIICHELVQSLLPSDRVAFSVRNMTGQTFRLFKNGLVPTVTYLQQACATKLSFEPSITNIVNMSPVEVSYPGLPQSAMTSRDQQRIRRPVLDLQVPGFGWLRDVQVDTFGRSFANIRSLSAEVIAKTEKDWRLKNMMQLLVEVGLQNGGRQVTIRSLFSVVNRTTHSVFVLLHPDASHQPKDSILSFSDSIKKEVKDGQSSLDADDAAAEIEPGKEFQIPVLLVEAALRQVGRHLGAVWMKPNIPPRGKEELRTLLGEKLQMEQNVSIQFSSRPVQLAKIVSESSLLFDNSKGQDITSERAKTGVQVSCPVVLDSGDRLAPFCYAIEVGRSPLVRGKATNSEERGKKKINVHGPVAYTIAVHPPFVLVNLLPVKGRFELMHAVRRTVLWYADLDPGKQVSVHSVGLDAPLLLLLNLGYCRTPVGEGALVHHGTDPPPGARDNLSGLKSIGKAGKAVTKQIGRTLTSIADSPDRRGHEKVNLAQNLYLLAKEEKPERVFQAKGRRDLGLDSEFEGLQNVDGKTYRIDTATFFPEDVADETTVVDNIGNRLVLNIENIRGGGGQRRISVFCPFWLVNTTEHALRYRQEGSKAFVSGTVLSPSLDGSKHLGGNAETEAVTEDDRLTGIRTIFSGTPGALATAAGRCDMPPDQVATLIDKTISLEKLANMAFMFNFHEGVVSVVHQRLCVQLADGTSKTQRYISDWSRGLSLDSVGFSQVLGIHCKDGRALELSVVVNVAPGFLSGYTKIVRFLPRYIVVNCLHQPLRLWQDSSTFRPSYAEQIEDSYIDYNWRYRGRRLKSNKVNQYEALWGRPALLDDRDIRMPLTTAHPSALYITTVAPSELIPFALPDSRGERQLRVDLGAPWKLTPSISADVPGEHTFPISTEVDLRSLAHIQSRASPEYEIQLLPLGDVPFSGELGVWFETEWASNRSLIVKAVKRESYAFNETDIHVGDELLEIDNIPVARMTFCDAMKTLRSRINDMTALQSNLPKTVRRSSMRFSSRARLPELEADTTSDVSPLTLKFRTVEERLRRVRIRAARIRGSHRRATQPLHASESGATRLDPGAFVKAELRTIHHSLFLILSNDPVVPFKIKNLTMRNAFYYRQRGCDGHQWNSLKPGQVALYSWEEPMKPKRLSARIASDRSSGPRGGEQHVNNNEITGNSRCPSSNTGQEREIGFLFTKVEEEEDNVFSPSVTVRLEEIGFREYIQSPVGATDSQQTSQSVELRVEVEGETRVLVVKDVSGELGNEEVLSHLDSLRSKIAKEEDRLLELSRLQGMVSEIDRISIFDSMSERGAGQTVYDVLKEAEKLMEDTDDSRFIKSRHQICVEVLEATGLSPETFVGDCNPYAEVTLQNRTFSDRSLFKNKDVRRTYFVRRSVAPTWIGQSFVFDVDPGFVNSTRGQMIEVKVKNFRVFGHHHILGKALVDFHSLRRQEPVTGWFHLAGRTGRRELENQLSHWGRGSIKLRIQWIYSIPALVQYFHLLSEKKLKEYADSLHGIEFQLRSKEEADSQKMYGVDGFKAVRVYDLVRLSRDKFKERNLQLIPPRALQEKVVKLVEPLRRGSGSGSHMFHQHLKWSLPTDALESKATTSFNNTSVPHAVKSGNAASSSVLRSLEDRISHHRMNLQRLLSSKSVEERFHATLLGAEYSASISVTSIKSWNMALAIFNDPELETEVDGDFILVRYRQQPRSTEECSLDFDAIATNRSDRIVIDKLCFKGHLWRTLATSMATYAREFLASRKSFERAADRSLRANLNPGGWLTIRPIAVMNLQDSYVGMSVKLRYGSELLTSETVDARVNPTWEQPKSDVSPDHVDPGSLHHRNELSVEVAPQQTNGMIRLSVVGERRHQQISSKTELGVLHIPLGSAIEACIDEASSKSILGDDHPSVPMYSRWFPLTRSKDAIPIEGDLALSMRPPDTEKTSETMFSEYFAPCIKLALIWWPDVDHESNSSDENLQSQFNGEEHSNTSSVSTYLSLVLGGYSCALIDSQRTFELASFSALDIGLKHWVTNAKTRFGLSVGWLQLDNQSEGAREPVIFAPTPTDSIFPIIQLLAVKDNIRSSSDVDSYDFVDVSVSEFDLTIEESFLFDLFGLFSSVTLRKRGLLRAATGAGKDASGSVVDFDSFYVGNDDDEPSLLSTLSPDSAGASRGQDKVYIEQLFLGMVRVNLSYLKGKKVIWELTSQGAWVDKRLDRLRSLQQMALQSGDRLVEFFSFQNETSAAFTAWSRHTTEEDQGIEKVGSQLPTLFASLFPNVSDAPVRLPGKALNHVFESPSEIFQSVRKFYVNETLKQVYKIVGSVDFVGNPTMLVASFFSGLRDLVVVPSMAFLKSPTDPSRVGLGFAAGTLSLFSHSTSGFFGFLAKVSAAAGQAVSTLSMDAEFRDWHRDHVVIEITNLNRGWKRRGLQSAGDMIARPMVDILSGVAGGVVGAFVSPIKGYRRGGIAGLTKGLAAGSIGFFAKPAVGVLDALAHFTASIHDVARSVNVLERRLQPALRLRHPYAFGMMSVLMPFDSATSRATQLLNLFPMKSQRAVPSEYLIHVEVLPNFGTDTYAIATSARIVLIRVKKEASGTPSHSLCWEVSLSGHEMVSSKVYDHGHNGVALTVTVTRPEDSENVLSNVDRTDESQSTGAEATPSVQRIELTEQGEPLTVEEVGQDFEHGTGRGVQGELLEWFTVLAEYQYRRQLARLHNAISCLVGDLASVMQDPSLGHKGSKEGYTTFGIYEFRQGDQIVTETLEGSNMIATVENLPWLPTSIIQAGSALSSDEQISFVSGLRSNWDSIEQLRAVRAEGGPEWLVVAKARAIQVCRPPTPMPDFDAEDDAADTDHDRILPRFLDRRKRYLHRSASEPGSTDQGTFDPEELGGLSEELRPSLLRRSKLTQSTDSDQTFRSAVGSLTGKSVYFSLPDLGLAEHFDEEDERVMTPAVVKSMRGETAKESAGADATASSAIEDIPSGGSPAPAGTNILTLPSGKDDVEVNSAASSNAMDLESGAEAGPPPATLASGDARMNRMEALMERLLIFSTEQALHTARAPVRAETATNAGGAILAATQEQLISLRQEVVDLKRQLEEQQQLPRAGNDRSVELIALQAEMELLKAQLAALTKGDEKV